MDNDLVDQIEADIERQEEALKELLDTADIFIDKYIQPQVVALLDTAVFDTYDFEEDLIEHLKERLEL